MSEYRDILVQLAVRGAVAALPFGLGWLILARWGGNWGEAELAVVGFGLLMLAALIVAPPLARLIGEPAGGLFYPVRRESRPPPLYSVGEARRKRGDFSGAIRHYREIARNYPQELRPYVEMIDIAILDLKDVALADAVLQRGLATLKREEDRAVLREMHRNSLSRLKGADGRPADAPARRRIPFRGAGAQPEEGPSGESPPRRGP